MTNTPETHRDFSREIYDKYFPSKGELLRITLTNGEILNGILVSFFHGEPDRREPFIIMWRFVSQEELDDYQHSPHKYQEYGRIIHQRDIIEIQSQ